MTSPPNIGVYIAGVNDLLNVGDIAMSSTFTVFYKYLDFVCGYLCIRVVVCILFFIKLSAILIYCGEVCIYSFRTIK